MSSTGKAATGETVEDAPVRTLSVCCARWSVVAAGRPGEAPVAVVHANRVVAVGVAAEAQGVVVGLRRRESQARCPGLEVLATDPGRDARAFEVVLGALEGIAPRWEVTEAGRCSVPSRGPARYHGGDRALVEAVHRRVVEALAEELPGASSAEVGVAVADGPRAAAVTADLAARDGGRGSTVVVAPGGTVAHLAPLPVACLAAGGPGWASPGVIEELVGVLRRLGVKRMGHLAALEPTDVLARFGHPGRQAHDLARGAERTLVVLEDVPVDLRVSAALDPPAERVEGVAFTAKVLADELHAELSARGLSATRVLVAAETELGDRIERLWRHEGALSAAAIAQRTRWQLEGWLSTGSGLGRCRGGVNRIELVPDQVVPDDGRQLRLWGGGADADAEQRARRAVARVQALLGPDAVLVPQWRGGRAPADRFVGVPFDMATPGTASPDTTNSVTGTPTGQPWPGALPAPAPAVVWPRPLPAEVCDAAGAPVGVGGRGLLDAAPARCSVAGGPWSEVVAWAGPWCVEERWWDPVGHRRRARLQAVVVPLDEDARSHRTAHLLALESGTWWVEATYD